MNDTSNLASILDVITEHALNYSLLLAAIGTLSMAFIELMKSVFSIRRHFNRWRFYHWMQDQSARVQTLTLAIGGTSYENALFEQPIERMLGQIQAAANLSLEYPNRYSEAYAFFTNEGLEIKSTARSRKQEPDNKVWASFVEDTAKKGLASTKAAREKQEEESRAAQQARVRLGNLIARRLDAFQNRTQYLWARGNQIAAVLTGTLLTAYVLTRGREIKEVEDMVALVCVSLLAGMIAPFAKDIVASISGIRTRV